MKKLLWGSMILILAACGEKKGPENNTEAEGTLANSTERGITTKGNTLDGMALATAHKWITNFENDNSNPKNITSVWFSRYWIEKTRAVLDVESGTPLTKPDGLRLYFAKDDNGQVTLVVLATKFGGKHPTDPKANIHTDFFDHFTAAYVRSAGNNADIKEEVATDEGATLYSTGFKCPPETCTITEEGHTITCETALTYVTNFKYNPTINNTKAEWYDKDLIDLIAKELTSANTGPNRIPADGVRVYFGRNEKKRNVLVFVTTERLTGTNGTIIHKDYFSCHGNKILANIPPEKGGYNRGEKCPNYCDGVDMPCDSCGEEKKLTNIKPAVSTKK